MFDRKQVKAEGKLSCKNNYWRSVLCALILGAFGTIYSLTYSQETPHGMEMFEDTPQGMDSDTLIALLLATAIIFAIKIFILNPLEIGCYGFFKDNMNAVRGKKLLDESADEVDFLFNKKPDLGVLRDGFANYGRMFLTLFLRDLFIVLWFCLFIIPGMVKTYSYRMVPYIIRDNPELSPTEAITLSRKIMNGNKFDVFIFDLSYFGWLLLGGLTFGLVNVFWTMPYWNNANAGIYLKLKEAQK